MDILQSIIGSLTKEESRSYKIFIHRTGDSGERMDGKLFDLIKQQFPEYDEEVIMKKLYKGEEKNSLYRLKNRVLEDLMKTLSLLYFNEEDTRSVLNQISLAIHFRKRSMWKVASYFLSRAEKKAVQLSNFQLLDLIYSEFILLSHETMLVNPEEYIRKRKDNQGQVEQVRQIDDILAAVIYRLQTSQNLGGTDTRILELLQKTVNDFARDKNTRHNPVLRQKIYEAVSKILLQKNDFRSLEKYLQRTYIEFVDDRFFQKSNHDTKLQMLTYIANCRFKLGLYKESLETAEVLHAAMKEYDSALYEKYLAFYYNVLVINYSQIQVQKAIAVLHEAGDHPVIKKLPIYDVFIHLNLAVTHFDIREFKPSLRYLLKLTMGESFRSLDAGFRYKVSIVELMIRLETGDTEYVLHKIGQIKKEFPKQWRDPALQREKEVLEIIAGLAETQSLRFDQALRKNIRFFLKRNPDASSDIIRYDHWLSRKMDPAN
ncbi:MAG: hypothetical protein IT233_13710 [Bacteroidia bacterium]|nr:hypothetical protein [Bacteroidia bacterium]